MECLLCGRQVDPQFDLFTMLFARPLFVSKVCSRCYQLFERINHKVSCPCCSKPQEKQKVCDDCLVWQKKLPHIALEHYALFVYNDAMHDYFRQYKFDGNPSLSAVFDYAIYQSLQRFRSVVKLVIPLSVDRQQQRGFNQVSHLLEAAQVGWTDGIIKSASSLAQTSKTRRERLMTSQPFQCTLEKTALKNQEIIIIDDVYTTGRTLYHAYELLMDYEPKRIRSFSLAR